MDVEVTVKLYGTLDRWVPAYDPLSGCRVRLAAPATVGDLIGHLGIPSRTVGLVSIDGRVANQADRLPDRSLVKLFHPIFGG